MSQENKTTQEIQAIAHRIIDDVQSSQELNNLQDVAERLRSIHRSARSLLLEPVPAKAVGTEAAIARGYEQEVERHIAGIMGLIAEAERIDQMSQEMLLLVVTMMNLATGTIQKYLRASSAVPSLMDLARPEVANG